MVAIAGGESDGTEIYDPIADSVEYLTQNFPNATGIQYIFLQLRILI